MSRQGIETRKPPNKGGFVLLYQDSLRLRATRGSNPDWLGERNGQKRENLPIKEVLLLLYQDSNPD